MPTLNQREETRELQLAQDLRPHAAAVAMVSGTASFSAPHLSRLSTTFGSDIAWRAACYEHGIARAAAGACAPFSVAMKDGRGRTSLAVDRFATHSLCYRVVHGELRFAPRADALVDAQTEIDPQAIFDYLFFHTIPSPRTIYRGIYRLPPGHCAVFENGSLQVAPYWKPGVPSASKSSFADLRHTFLQLLSQAVGKQLGAGLPACTLATGIDSCSMASIIGAVSGQPARTYSVGFDASATKHAGTLHSEHVLSADDLVRSISTLASHYDQPFGSVLTLPAYYCANMARADGVKRLLVSEGGDALFGSSMHLPNQRMLGWFGALPAMLRQQASGDAQIHMAPPEQLHLYRLLNRLGMERFFTSDFLRGVNPMACSEGTPPRENNVPMAHGISSLAGVEVGFPLLDQKLHDFWLALPDAYRDKGPRWFFKKALHDLVPKPLRKKTKPAGALERGLAGGLPFGRWLCQHAGLRKLASDGLHGVAERGIVRRDFIHTLLGPQLQHHPGYYGEMAWLLLVLEYWLRAHAPLYRVQT